jgi:integrase
LGQLGHLGQLGQRPDSTPDTVPPSRLLSRPRGTPASAHCASCRDEAKRGNVVGIFLALRLAFDILLYTAQRVGDVVRMHRSDIRNGVITVVQQKTGAEVFVPLHPALGRSIKAAPASGIYLVGDKNGRPITRRTLTVLISVATKAAGLPAECVAHGLRKAALRRLAEHGATSKEMQAISGHRSLAETERYTQQADQRRLARAAIGTLPDKD